MAWTETDTETADCPLCESVDHEVRYSRFAPFIVSRCCGCGTFFLSKRLKATRMEEVYRSSDYFEGGSHGYASHAAQEPAERLTFRHLLRELDRAGLTGGDLLDVGCGRGLFLEEAKGFFERREGTEFSGETAALAGKRADEIYVGGASACPPGPRFAFVSALQVIEHAYDPRLLVRHMIERTRVGGWVLVATPDIGSFWFTLQRGRWSSFKIPEHVVFFDQTSLTRLLESSGLNDLRVIPYPHAFPLSLILSKFGFSGPPNFRSFNVWLPRTTIAIAGRRVK